MRARNRRTSAATAGGSDQAPVEVEVKPPPHLTKPEKALWRYYAPLLAEAGRLTLEARDTLAKYCTALATVARLKEQMQAEDYKDTYVGVSGDLRPHPLLMQLRQWLIVCRGYESDLLVAPSAAVRAPGGSGGGDDESEAEDFDFYPRAVG